MNDRTPVSRWNTIFRCLAAEPRREIVATLSEVDSNATIPMPESALSPHSSADPDRLQTELYHTHLPMLADNGYVEWHPEPFVAERGPAFREIDAVLAAIVDGADYFPPDLIEDCDRLERAADGE